MKLLLVTHTFGHHHCPFLIVITVYLAIIYKILIFMSMRTCLMSETHF